jgi:hypothetical protein
LPDWTGFGEQLTPVAVAMAVAGITEAASGVGWPLNGSTPAV